MKTKYLIGKLVSPEGNSPLGYLVGEVSFKGDGAPSIVGSFGVKELISESEVGAEGEESVRWLKDSFSYKEFNLDRLPVYEGSGENLSSSGLKLIKDGGIRLVMLYGRTVYYLNERGRLACELFSTDERIRAWVNSRRVLFACDSSRELEKLYKYVTVDGKMFGDKEYEKSVARNRLTHEDCGLYSVSSSNGMISLLGFSQCYNSVCKLGSFVEYAIIKGSDIRNSGISVLDMSDCRKLMFLGIECTKAKILLPSGSDNECVVNLYVSNNPPDGLLKLISDKNVRASVTMRGTTLSGLKRDEVLVFNCVNLEISAVSGLPRKVSVTSGNVVSISDCSGVEELDITLTGEYGVNVRNCADLRDVTVSGIKCLHVNDLQSLFENCPKLESITLSCEEFTAKGLLLDSSKVTNFEYIRRLVSVNDTTGGKVKRLSIAANKCGRVEHIGTAPIVYSVGDTEIVVSDNIKSFFRYIKPSKGVLELLRCSEIFAVFDVGSGGFHIMANSIYLVESSRNELFKQLSIVRSESGDTFIVPSDVMEISGSVFSGIPDLKRVLLCSSIVVGAYAFEGSTIEEIEGSEHIEKICSCAFSGSKIRSITFSEKIENIPEYAFSGCAELKEVKFLGDTKVDKRAFVGCIALNEESLKEIWKRGAGKDREFVWDALFSDEFERSAKETIPITLEYLRYTYAIYNLVDIYGKERLYSCMSEESDRESFLYDLSYILKRRAALEADIREASKAGRSVSEDTLELEGKARKVFREYSELLSAAVGGSEIVPTGYENKEEWEKLRGYARGSL